MEKGIQIVLHVHAEVIVEMDEDVDVICRMMGKAPEWVDRLGLNKNAYKYRSYMKG